MKALTVVNLAVLFASALCLCGGVVSDLRSQEARHAAELAAARAEDSRCRCNGEIPANLRNGVLPPSRRRGYGELPSEN